MAERKKSPGLTKKDIELLFLPYPDRKELYYTKDGQSFVDKGHALAHGSASGNEMFVLKNPKHK